MLRASLLLGLLIAFRATAVADEASPTALTERQKEVGGLAERFLGETELLDGDAPLVPVGPLIRWSNPTVGEVHGETYLWTRDGRPVCIGSVYHWFTPNWGDTLEIGSLTDHPLRGRQGGGPFWTPTGAKVVWDDLAGADAPAATPAARLVQMRRLVRGVSATLGDTRGAKEGVSRRLRLMPQPLYRYTPPTPTATYLDGAVFAFVEGTDPELLLMVEAVTQGGQPLWRSAFARVNSDAIEARWEEGEPGARASWSVEKLEYADILSATNKPYALFPLSGTSGRVKP